ncbi:TetR/AcrR family transcriptional regulator [Streptomyces sp. DSM 44917]|uniref:TetR/AcrR family transcriptional regulator n=1 Tax=Streptomyces boetiae TaxID=3075541 RepID=A0ABU2L1G4_9ACTN|nr:TetR/AcrR family transcriptional regulator [Streptomyces sp. DSM 44917]MDT0305399.1 TetR/AcrR family transcriptional regulator [Streptomyces sp. DSM 44917]
MTNPPAGRHRSDIGRSLELMWRGPERSGRGPKPALTLEGIVGAAVHLADREGLAALSMRRVAAELGVGTMSLYRYVPGKGELLDLMVDHVSGPPAEVRAAREQREGRAGKDWRAVLQLIGETTYRLYRAHPWLLQVNQSRPLLGPNTLLGLDFALGALDGLGLGSRERISVIMTLDSFITGIARQHVLSRLAAEETGISDEDFWAAQVPLMESAMASGAYPHVFSLTEDAFSVAEEDMLRFGLTRILDGIETFLGNAAAERQASGPEAGAGVRARG